MSFAGRAQLQPTPNAINTKILASRLARRNITYQATHVSALPQLPEPGRGPSHWASRSRERPRNASLNRPLPWCSSSLRTTDAAPDSATALSYDQEFRRRGCCGCAKPPGGLKVTRARRRQTSTGGHGLGGEYPIVLGDRAGLLRGSARCWYAEQLHAVGVRSGFFPHLGASPSICPPLWAGGVCACYRSWCRPTGPGEGLLQRARQGLAREDSGEDRERAPRRVAMVPVPDKTTNSSVVRLHAWISLSTRRCWLHNRPSIRHASPTLVVISRRSDMGPRQRVRSPEALVRRDPPRKPGRGSPGIRGTHAEEPQTRWARSGLIPNWGNLSYSLARCAQNGAS